MQIGKSKQQELEGIECRNSVQAVEAVRLFWIWKMMMKFGRAHKVKKGIEERESQLSWPVEIEVYFSKCVLADGRDNVTRCGDKEIILVW